MNARLLLVGCVRHLSQHRANQNSSSSGEDAESPRGRVFDCKPARVMLEAGKMYGWCTCGYSNKQVFHLTANKFRWDFLTHSIQLKATLFQRRWTWNSTINIVNKTQTSPPLPPPGKLDETSASSLYWPFARLCENNDIHKTRSSLHNALHCRQQRSKPHVACVDNLAIFARVVFTLRHHVDTVYAVVLCLSVRLSVTSQYCTKIAS